MHENFSEKVGAAPDGAGARIELADANAPHLVRRRGLGDDRVLRVPQYELLGEVLSELEHVALHGNFEPHRVPRSLVVVTHAAPELLALVRRDRVHHNPSLGLCVAEEACFGGHEVLLGEQVEHAVVVGERRVVEL